MITAQSLDSQVETKQEPLPLSSIVDLTPLRSTLFDLAHEASSVIGDMWRRIITLRGMLWACFSQQFYVDFQ